MGFPTQRMAPERKGQPRGVGGFSTRTPYLLLSQCTSLVRTFPRDPGGGLRAKECEGAWFFRLSELIGSNLADHVDCTVTSIVFSHSNRL